MLPQSATTALSCSLSKLIELILILHFFILIELYWQQSSEYSPISTSLWFILGNILRGIIRHIFGVFGRKVSYKGFPQLKGFTAAYCFDWSELLFEEINYEAEDAVVETSLGVRHHKHCWFFNHNFLNLIKKFGTVVNDFLREFKTIVTHFEWAHYTLSNFKTKSID